MTPRCSSHLSLTPIGGPLIVRPMGMSRRVRRWLPVGLGILAAVAILAVLTSAGDGAVDLVCNIGTNLDQPAYERCIAELPALQAQHAEDMRVRIAMRPVVSLAGGVIVALAAHLTVRSRTPKYPPVEDDPRTVAGGPGPGDIGGHKDVAVP